MRKSVLIVVCLALFACVAHADTVRTKDGQTIHGRILKETKEAIHIRTKFGILVIPKKEVRKHDRATYVVELKDGTKPEGRIVGETEKELTLKVGEETKTLALTDIKGVTQKKAPPKPKRLSPDQRRKLHMQGIDLLRKKQFDKSIAIYKQLLASDPEDQIALYNLSCAYALSGKKTEALDLLEKSVKAGYVNFEHIEGDPDMDSLREEPRYKELFANKAEHIKASSEKAVERITKSLKRKGIDAKAYKTHFDNERNFVYLHTKTEEQLKILRTGLEEYAEFQWKTLFQNKPAQPLYIVLLRQQDSRKVLGGRAGGVFNPGTNTLFCGDMPTYKLLRTSVIIHEFTHALHFADQTKRRQRHPIWLIEGLATLFEASDRAKGTCTPRHSYRLNVVQSAVRSGRSVPWLTIMKMQHPQFMRAAQLCYAQSRYMLFYMYEKGYLKKFYDEYTAQSGFKNDKTAAESFEVVFGKPLSAVEHEWKAWVMKQKVPPVPFLGVNMADKNKKVVVTKVSPNSPAAKAELKAGDVIVSLAGQPIRTRSDLIEAVGNKKVGEEVDISIERGGKAMELTAKLGKRGGSPKRVAKAGPAYIGLTVEAKEKAVLVKEVAKDSPAAKAGIEVGAAILECQGKKVANIREYLAAVKKAKTGTAFKIKVRKGEEEPKELTVTPSTLPKVANK